MHPPTGTSQKAAKRSSCSSGATRSFIEWDSAEALDAWRNHAGFKERYAALESLCREIVGSTYEEGVRVR